LSVIASRSGGTSGTTWVGGTTFENSTRASVSAVVPLANRYWPVSICQSITPTANRSLRPSSAPPLICSGLM
jgi:hypothetical protein